MYIILFKSYNTCWISSTIYTDLEAAIEYADSTRYSNEEGYVIYSKLSDYAMIPVHKSNNSKELEIY